MGYKHTNSKGKTYFLNTKEVTLNGGRKQNIYFFSKDARDSACEVPDGYEVSESGHGLPVMRKKK